MGTFSAPTAEQARQFGRVVEYAEAIPGAQLSATVGQTPRKLNGLYMVGAFLQPIDELTSADIHATVNFINPSGLAGWVRETIGDEELGAALSTIAGDGRAFGFQVRDIKPLITERLAQYDEALAEPGEESAS